MIAPATARRVWETLEPLHASVYFAPEPAEAFAKLGLKGFWMGYVAGAITGRPVRGAGGAAGRAR